MSGESKESAFASLEPILGLKRTGLEEVLLSIDLERFYKENPRHAKTADDLILARPGSGGQPDGFLGAGAR